MLSGNDSSKYRRFCPWIAGEVIELEGRGTVVHRPDRLLHEVSCDRCHVMTHDGVERGHLPRLLAVVAEEVGIGLKRRWIVTGPRMAHLSSRTLYHHERIANRLWGAPFVGE